MREELKDCYILSISFTISKIDKLPLYDFYKRGYWISAVFGERCYLVRKCVHKKSITFASHPRFCELTPRGMKFIEEYAEKQAKKYEKYLNKTRRQQPWEYLR